MLSGGALGTIAAGLTYKLMDPDAYMKGRTEVIEQETQKLQDQINDFGKKNPEAPNIILNTKGKTNAEREAALEAAKAEL